MTRTNLIAISILAALLVSTPSVQAQQYSPSSLDDIWRDHCFPLGPSGHVGPDGQVGPVPPGPIQTTLAPICTVIVAVQQLFRRATPLQSLAYAYTNEGDLVELGEVIEVTHAGGSDSPWIRFHESYPHIGGHVARFDLSTLPFEITQVEPDVDCEEGRTGISVAAAERERVVIAGEIVWTHNDEPAFLSDSPDNAEFPCYSGTSPVFGISSIGGTTILDELDRDRGIFLIVRTAAE